MAGVAGPALRRSRLEGTRFLSGLLVGEVAASMLLGMILFGVGSLLPLLARLLVRQTIVVAVLALLGAADIADRTPHIWRQVPQSLVRYMTPGRLGIAWGFDLGWLFTTQKSTSLAWAALTGVCLLSPGSAWYALVTMAIVGVTAITVRSIIFNLTSLPRQGDGSRRWFASMRRSSGIVLLALAGVIAIRSW